MNKGQKDGEPSKTWPKLSLITEQDLKNIKIAIRRNNIPISSIVSSLRRKIESPETLKIHITDKTFRPLFDKDDIVVNQGGHDVCRAIKRQSDNRARSSSPISDADTTADIKTDYKHHASRIVKNNYNKCRPPFRLPPEEEEYSSKKSDETHYPSTSCKRHESGEHSRRHPSHKYNYESNKRMRSSRSPSFEHRKLRRRSPSPYSNYEKSEYKYYPATSKYRRSRSPIQPGEYRPRRSPSRERRHSRSSRPGEYRPHLNKNRRSSTPLEPGEYRPRRSRSPIKSEYRIERRSTSRERWRSCSAHRTRERRRSSDSRLSPLRPGEYRPTTRPPQHYGIPRHSSDYVFYEGDYTTLLKPPLMPRGMLRPGHILVPRVQYIPVPHMPSIGPQVIRPPKIYNNRPIPRLVTPSRTISCVTSRERRRSC